jgi:predicted enzyme related to lactoylglutathione lyase
MDAFKTHGAFSWMELMTSDPDGAIDFYKKVFGWTVEKMEMGTGPYNVVKVGDTAVGGIMNIPPNAPPGMPPMWGSYVTVDDVDKTAEIVTKNGGNVIVPGFDVPTVGRIAVVQDPQGATLSLISYVEQEATV